MTTGWSVRAFVCNKGLLHQGNGDLRIIIVCHPASFSFLISTLRSLSNVPRTRAMPIQRRHPVPTMSRNSQTFSTSPFLPSSPKVLSPILISSSHSTNRLLTLSHRRSQQSRPIPIPNSDNAPLSSSHPSNIFRRSSPSTSTLSLRFSDFSQRSARYRGSSEILRHGKHAQQASPSPQPDTKSGRSKTTQTQPQQPMPAVQQQAQQPSQPQQQQQHRRNDEYSSMLTTSTGKQLALIYSHTWRLISYN